MTKGIPQAFTVAVAKGNPQATAAKLNAGVKIPCRHNTSMPIENCSAPGCEYKTADYPAVQALEALRLHGRLTHPELFANATTTEPQKKAISKRPVLQMTGQSCEEGHWDFFIQKYDMYARSCNIPPDQSNDCFRECLHGPDVSSQTIQDLKTNVNKLVVMAKNRVASVVELKAIKQQQLARLKSAARRLDFKMTKACECGKDVTVDYTEDIIRDEFIAGLLDEDAR